MLPKSHGTELVKTSSPCKKYSVIPRQNKDREKWTQLETKTTKNRFWNEELGQCGILIHASWEAAFSVFHCVKVSFGSVGVFQRASGQYKVRMDVWRCDALGSSDILSVSTNDTLQRQHNNHSWCTSKTHHCLFKVILRHNKLIFEISLKAGWLKINKLTLAKNCQVFCGGFVQSCHKTRPTASLLITACNRIPSNVRKASTTNRKKNIFGSKKGRRFSRFQFMVCIHPLQNMYRRCTRSFYENKNRMLFHTYQLQQSMNPRVGGSLPSSPQSMAICRSVSVNEFSQGDL